MGASAGLYPPAKIHVLERKGEGLVAATPKSRRPSSGSSAQELAPFDRAKASIAQTSLSNTRWSRAFLARSTNSSAWSRNSFSEPAFGTQIRNRPENLENCVCKKETLLPLYPNCKDHESVRFPVFYSQNGVWVP